MHLKLLLSQMGTSALKDRLYAGITENDTKVIQKILQQSPELINQPTTQDSNSLPILRATYLNRPQILQILIKLGANLQIMGSSQISALMWAARRGHDQCIQLLIAAGANLKTKGKFQMTASDYAVLFGRFESALVFKSKGSLPTKSAKEFETIRNQLMTLEVDFEGFLQALNQACPANVNFAIQKKRQQSPQEKGCDEECRGKGKIQVKSRSFSLNRRAFGIDQPLQQGRFGQEYTEQTLETYFGGIRVRQAWDEQ